MSDDRKALELAERVRRACLEALLAAYEDAGRSGLCAEGRWEAAVGALRSLDIGAVAAAPPESSYRRGSGLP
jgi:hypothetical protein